MVAVDARGDDDAGTKGSTAVGLGDVDVVRGDGSVDRAVGGPVFGEARERIVAIFGGVLLPFGVVVVDGVGLGVVLRFEGVKEGVDGCS